LKLPEIKDEIRSWPRHEQELLRDWLENLLEDGLTMTGSFQCKIESGFRQIAEGKVRVRKPE
jgi:hypothetical protein